METPYARNAWQALAGVAVGLPWREVSRSSLRGVVCVQASRPGLTRTPICCRRGLGL